VASAFNSDGTLRTAWMNRAARAIEAADARGQTVILSYFYQQQDQVLANDNAVRAAVRNATDWIISRGYRNVIIEIANEHNHNGFDHAIIRTNTKDGSYAGEIAELVQIAQQRFDAQNYRLPVSASTSGKIIFKRNSNLQKVADLALTHGNSCKDWDADGDGSMDCDTSALLRDRVNENSYPVVMNEDHNVVGGPGSGDLAEEIEASSEAFQAGASWGYMYQNYNQAYPGSGCCFEWALGASPNNPTTEANLFHAVLDHIQGTITGTPSPAP
jgi:hypothetical protein